MKGHLLISILLLIFFGLTSCKEDIVEEDYTYSIDSLWWTDEVDFNSDEYVQAKNLHFSVKLEEKVSRRVIAQIYYKINSASDFSFYSFSDEQIIEGDLAENEIEMTIGHPTKDLPKGSYDFSIELYEANRNQLEAKVEPNDSSILSRNKFEKAENDKVFTTNAWWTDFYDKTENGYSRQGRLLIDVNIDSNSTKEIYVKLYNRIEGGYDYDLIYTFDNFTINGASEEDSISFWIHNPEFELEHNLYDFKIEVYETSSNELVDFIDANTNSELNDIAFETEDEDSFFYTIDFIEWRDSTDIDSDTYNSTRQIAFDVNVDKEAVRQMYAKFFYRHPDSTDYSIYDSSGIFSITGTSGSDIQTFLIGNANVQLDSNQYDFLISVFENPPDSLQINAAYISASTEPILENQKFETIHQDSTGIK